MGAFLRLKMDARREGEVLVVSVEGLITQAAVIELRAFMSLLLEERDARAVLIDFRRAVSLLGAEGWMAAARSTVESAHGAGGSAEIIEPPCAMLVSPVYREEVEVFCLEVATCGLERLVFTDYEFALAWAADWRVHWRWAPERPELAGLPAAQEAQAQEGE